MGWLIWGVLLPGCLVASWHIARNPFWRIVEEIQVDQARALFRQRREWLEARFLGSVAQATPIEGLRWEGAHWHDEVHWARDCKSRSLLALVEVHFDADPYDDPVEPHARHATALFEYRKGRWFADGTRLEATRPGDAFVTNGRFEPVAAPYRRG
jgi:hypothetical protein